MNKGVYSWINHISGDGITISPCKTDQRYRTINLFFSKEGITTIRRIGRYFTKYEQRGVIQDFFLFIINSHRTLYSSSSLEISRNGGCLRCSYWVMFHYFRCPRTFDRSSPYTLCLINIGHHRSFLVVVVFGMESLLTRRQGNKLESLKSYTVVLDLLSTECTWGVRRVWILTKLKGK